MTVDVVQLLISGAGLIITVLIVFGGVKANTAMLTEQGKWIKETLDKYNAEFLRIHEKCEAHAKEIGELQGIHQLNTQRIVELERITRGSTP